MSLNTRTTRHSSRLLARYCEYVGCVGGDGGGGGGFSLLQLEHTTPRAPCTNAMCNFCHLILIFNI